MTNNGLTFTGDYLYILFTKKDEIEIPETPEWGNIRLYIIINMIDETNVVTTRCTSLDCKICFWCRTLHEYCIVLIMSLAKSRRKCWYLSLSPWLNSQTDSHMVVSIIVYLISSKLRFQYTCIFQNLFQFHHCGTLYIV